MGRIVQPVGKIKLTNVAIVRYECNGKRFEIACYKNKIVNWRNGIEKDIDEVLQIPYIFLNATKGVTASNSDLEKAFGTSDTEKVSRIILEKGKEQISEKERSHQIEDMNKEIATLISEMCYNPKVDTPFTVGMIQRAMKDSHVNIKLNQSTKKQALDIIQILKKSMPIERKQMLIQLVCRRSDIEVLKTFCDETIGLKVLETSDKNTNVAWNCVIFSSQYREIETFCQQRKGFSCEILVRQYVHKDENQDEQKTQGEVVEEAVVQPVEQQKAYQMMTFKCSTCEIGFMQASEHREHFRSDWHRYNMKRKNRNLPVMSEAEYNSLDENDREFFLSQDSIATFLVCFIFF